MMSRQCPTRDVIAFPALGDDHIMPTAIRTYLIWFQKTLILVSNRASIKPVVMAAQTLGTTGTESQTHLILARLDTEVSVF